MLLDLILLAQSASAAFCSSDGSTNSVTRSLTYDATTGKFTGTMTTNLCPNFPFANYSTGEVAKAKAEVSSKTITFPGSGYANPPLAAPTRGAVAYSLYGVNIYGPMDNGFATGSACSDNLGSCVAGTDVAVCEQQLKNQCGSSFKNTMFLDVCGGHANPYHFHTDLVCDYNKNASGHSPLIGIALDGRGIYGLKESSYSLPTDLDACGGHYGPVPATTIGGVTYPAASNVYHYHTQTVAPFTVGCFGPVSSLAQCKGLYGTCSSGTTTLSGLNGSATCSYEYDTDCPCYGSSNVYSYNQQCGETKTVAAAVTYSLATTTASWATTTKASSGSNGKSIDQRLVMGLMIALMMFA